MEKINANVPEEFLNQFRNLESYLKPRTFDEVIPDFMKLYEIDKELAVKFTFYMRMIDRNVDYIDGGQTLVPQHGAGLKHEAKLRMMALSLIEPDLFWDNIGLFISAGSWKDIFDMLRYDLAANSWDTRILDWNKFGALIVAGLDNDNCSDYVKKYMPLIKARSQCRTGRAECNVTIGKWLCCLLFGNKDNPHFYKKYRLIKVSGNKHKWQQLISKGRHDLIDFKNIHGKALFILSKGKYARNHKEELKMCNKRNPEIRNKYMKFCHHPKVRRTGRVVIKTFDMKYATESEIFLKEMDQELINRINF